MRPVVSYARLAAVAGFANAQVHAVGWPNGFHAMPLTSGLPFQFKAVRRPVES